MTGLEEAAMAAGRYVHRFDIDDRHSVHIYQGSLAEEQVLKDLLRLYGLYLFGPGFERELVQQQIIPLRRDGGVARPTLGQVRDALAQLEALVKRKANFKGAANSATLAQGLPSA
jgi:hypothetical protein